MRVQCVTGLQGILGEGHMAGAGPRRGLGRYLAWECYLLRPTLPGQGALFQALTGVGGDRQVHAAGFLHGPK